MEICPQQQPIPTSQIAQDVLDHTEMIHQDVRKNAMQAYMKYKALLQEKGQRFKAQRSRIGIRFTAKADHQRSEVPFTEFRWIGPHIFEKMLPNNNYLVRKNGSNKTQVHQRMLMRQFTPSQTPADIRITPREWKPDPQMSVKPDDFYARTRECEYEQPIFDAENINAMPLNSSDIPVHSDLSTKEMENTPGTAHECSPEI